MTQLSVSPRLVSANMGILFAELAYARLETSPAFCSSRPPSVLRKICQARHKLVSPLSHQRFGPLACCAGEPLALAKGRYWDDLCGPKKKRKLVCPTIP